MKLISKIIDYIVNTLCVIGLGILIFWIAAFFLSRTSRMASFHDDDHFCTDLAKKYARYQDMPSVFWQCMHDHGWTSDLVIARQP